MDKTPSETIAKLNAINRWLEAIYRKKLHISDLLEQAGFSQETIDQIKNSCLVAYVEEVINYIASIDSGHDSNRRHAIVLRYYGLLNGQPETLEEIGNELGISRERVRQLRNKRMQMLSTRKSKAAFEAELATIANRILEP